MNINIEIHNGYYVLRDDRLLGGTKSVFIEKLIDPTKSEYVYASPVYGGFQIALSGVCKKLNKQAIIFCAKRKTPHPNSLRCKQLGAKVYQVPYGYLSNVQAKAKEYSKKHPYSQNLPFGADSLVSVNAIAERMNDISVTLGFEPDIIYCAIGSGTLVKGILQGTNKAQVRGISVGKHCNLRHERLSIHDYPKPFDKPSKYKADFDSCANYDLKAWEVLNEEKPKGKVLFWNVL